MPKTLATATVDQLLHHAHIVLTEGTSLRLVQATAGNGVIPLDLDQQELNCPPAGRSSCPLTVAAFSCSTATCT